VAADPGRHRRLDPGLEDPFAILGTIVAALVVGAAGGALIAGGPGVAPCGGSEPTTLTTEHRTFGSAADVSLDFNCGTLEVGTPDGDEWSVASGRRTGDPAEITASGDRLVVESSDRDGWWNGGRQHWIVGLPTGTTYQLEITPNAADASIDLGGGRFRSVSLLPMRARYASSCRTPCCFAGQSNTPESNGNAPPDRLMRHVLVERLNGRPPPTGSGAAGCRSVPIHCQDRRPPHGVRHPLPLLDLGAVTH
jgi:hypothetical protein